MPSPLLHEPHNWSASENIKLQGIRVRSTFSGKGHEEGPLRSVGMRSRQELDHFVDTRDAREGDSAKVMRYSY